MDKEPQETNHTSILTAVQIAATKEIIEAEVARYIDYLPQKIEQILYQTTLSVLGLREARGTLRFDKSEGNWLEEIFRSAADQAVNRQISEYVNKTVYRAMSDSNLMLDIKRAIYKTYRETMINKLRTAMQARADEDAGQCVRALANSLTFNADQDPADPESFQGPLGEIILRQLAKNIVDEEDSHGEIGFNGEDFTTTPDDDDIPF